MLKRFEIVNRSGYADHRAEAFRKNFGWDCRYVDVIWLSSPQELNWDEALGGILLDSVLHEPSLKPMLIGQALERRLLPGMTDNRARTLREALQLHVGDLRIEELSIRTGEMVVVDENVDLSDPELKHHLSPWWMNPVIHEFQTYSVSEFENLSRHESSTIRNLFPPSPPESRIPDFKTFDLDRMRPSELESLSEDRTLALSLVELTAIQAHFRKIGRDCTDVELEVIAQTWSEHCQHKLFGARIEYQSLDAADIAPEIPNSIAGLFRETIRKTTADNPRPWLLSVFSDNAGIVQFTENQAVCLKVETHNSPSALDPFGGAITGIVGVNRDILGCGLGAKPIANMDVFCVAPEGTPNPMPEKIISPEVILEGIRAGVEAGGNQSGIPTVNGSVTFHPSYLGKPLVFCGTLGLMPTRVGNRRIEEKKVFSGDQIVMVGGRIGRDGIHGATFSSMALTESVQGSVVQLGDPITQKRMADFLMEARDLELFQAITDNGAGGLSSSVGEMAKLTGGARMDVGLAPTKVPGLKPYERVISESQERMTLAVSPRKVRAFMDLARRRGVETTVLGEFNTTGKFQIDFQGNRVADLDLKFLHEGTPEIQMMAKWDGVPSGDPVDFKPYSNVKLLEEDWRNVLSHPNVASKEWIIRQYDHEVQARTVIKPLTTLEDRSSPMDAAVIALNGEGDSAVAAVLGHGLCPLSAEGDPYLMAQLAVDEALRNVFCAGAEYSAGDLSRVISLVDNFCWPDPSRSPSVAAALVRTAYGMRKACLEFGIPLISGKDSMKNNFKSEKNGEKIEISVLPTLLMTALGRIRDLSKARSSEFKRAGDEVFLLGPSQVTLRASIFEDLGKVEKGSGKLVYPHYAQARAIYSFLGSVEAHCLASAHDCSEGGLFTALAESGFARNLGLHLKTIDGLNAEFAFGEGFHRVVVSCKDEDSHSLQNHWVSQGIPFLHLGKVSAEPRITHGNFKIELSTLRSAWERRSI